MLLKETRDQNLRQALQIICLDSFFLVVSLGTADSFFRACILGLMAIGSYQAIKGLRKANRIDPMVAAYEEWTDQEIVFALMNKPDKTEDQQYDRLIWESLQLDNYLFVGNQAENLRSRLIRTLQGKFPELLVLNTSNKDHAVKLKLEVETRQNNRDKAYPGILLLCNGLTNANSLALSNLGIYLLVSQDADNHYMTKNKFLPSDLIRSYDPNFAINEYAFWDGRKVHLV